MYCIRAVVLLLAVLLPATAAAALSALEQRICSAVDAEPEQPIALLQALVEQNSGTMNLQGVEAVARLLQPQFEALGFIVEWKPMTDTQRAGHLIARHRGRPDTARMLLIGHLDTVFEPDAPFQGFVREGDRAIGPGVSDNKGGLVVMLAALRAMHAAGSLRDADIEVVLSGDEESAGDPIELARADLVAAGKRADVALDFENLSQQDGKDMGVVARRSSNFWSLHTRGRSAHSSIIFSEGVGDGAIYEMTRIISGFHSELPEPNLTFNIGLIGGGQSAELDAAGVRITATGKGNIIASSAIAQGDFRTLSQAQSERVVAKMQAIVARHLPHTEATLRIETGYPAMPPTDGNRALLARLNAINRDLGLESMTELDPLKRGAGDIAFIAADIDGLVGLGIAGENTHAPGESADLSSIPRQAKRAAILMTRLSQSAY